MGGGQSGLSAIGKSKARVYIERSTIEGHARRRQAPAYADRRACDVAAPRPTAGSRVERALTGLRGFTLVIALVAAVAAAAA